MAPVDRSFFLRPTVTVARRLLGQRLVRRLPDGTRLSGTIVETEAYLGPEDKAAHTFGWRRTERTEAMFMAAGTAYVFLTYGMHHCLNFSTVGEDIPQAVLVRALEPTEGIEDMKQLRPAARRHRDLCNGPAKLTQALRIGRDFDQHDTVGSDTLWVEQARKRALPASRIAVGPRIGIDYAEEWAAEPLRFWVAGNPYVSR